MDKADAWTRSLCTTDNGGSGNTPAQVAGSSHARPATSPAKPRCVGIAVSDPSWHKYPGNTLDLTSLDLIYARFGMPRNHISTLALEYFSFSPRSLVHASVLEHAHTHTVAASFRELIQLTLI